MFERIQVLKNRYAAATTDAERDAVNDEMTVLLNSNVEGLDEALMQSLDDTVIRAKELSLKIKLKEILPIVSLSYISEHYFNKSKSWFYQRLNGNEVNGKTASFTQDEIKTLDYALKDISKKLDAISLTS